MFINILLGFTDLLLAITFSEEIFTLFLKKPSSNFAWQYYIEVKDSKLQFSTVKIKIYTNVFIHLAS